MYAAKCSVLANANTQAKINALIGKRVAFDFGVLATGVCSVDSGDADAVTNGVIIVGGNPATSELYFMLRSNVTGLIGNITT